MSPRERLLCCGPGALTDVELLAVLFGAPTATPAAERLLKRAGGLMGLRCADWPTLRAFGMRGARASRLLAHVELSKRATREAMPDGQLMSRPDRVAAYIAARHAAEDQEIVGALYLNVRDRLIGDRVLFRGTLYGAAVEPRRILREALQLRAAHFILWHTHPSGLPIPSDEDLAFTRRIASAARIVGVRLAGHIIVGNGGRYTALNEPR